jgi:hypothetical protein
VGIKWVSACADVADATNGDAATWSNIVAAASQEAPNGYNYVKSGSQGTFSETAGSGTLEFTDAVFNTAFSLVPQVVIPPGQAIDLLYQATFNNSILLIPTGTSLRAEVIVTFGNSGIRGGSGSSGQNININGDTGVDSVPSDGLPAGQSGADDGDERLVRSVPDRQTMVVPAVEKCNDSLTLSDLEANIVGTGTVTFSSYSTDIGGGTGQEDTSTSITRYLSVEVNGGTDGGSITNCADLAGQSSTTIVYGPIDPNTGLPMFSYEFPCCTGVDLQDCSSFDLNGHVSLDACTYTQGGWGAPPNGGNPAQNLTDHFVAVYPSGVEVGIPGAGGFSMLFTSAPTVIAYLPAGGKAGALTADLVNPTSTSSGVFGGQVLALQLNVDLSAAGAIPQGLGALTVCNTGTSLDGQTIAQVLAAANTALGGGGLPSGFTFDTLNDLVTNLNEAFDNCEMSDWAAIHICGP